MDAALSRFLDEALKSQGDAQPLDAQKLTNWLLTDVAGYLAAREQPLSASALTPVHLAALVRLIDAGTLSGKMAKDLLPDVMQGADPAELVRERGLAVVTDTAAIEAAIDAALQADPATVQKVQAGNAKAMNALFGPVMKALGGQAKPDVVRRLLQQKLGV